MDSSVINTFRNRVREGVLPTINTFRNTMRNWSGKIGGVINTFANYGSKIHHSIGKWLPLYRATPWSSAIGTGLGIAHRIGNLLENFGKGEDEKVHREVSNIARRAGNILHA
jgi:hypothetical protein